MVYFFLDFFFSVYAMSYVCVHAYMCICVCMHVYVCICACMHVYVCMHTCNMSASALLQGMRNKQQTCFFKKKMKKTGSARTVGCYRSYYCDAHGWVRAGVFIFYFLFLFFIFSKLQMRIHAMHKAGSCTCAVRARAAHVGFRLRV